MKNKYYTPDITEFHSGFEYEIRFIDEDDNFKWAWQKLSYELDGSWKNTEEDLQEEIDCGRFRVKYLDREDIESFGFTTEDNGECYNLQEEHVLYGLYPWERDNEYKITIDSNAVFLGIIKNKSELKKLLTQLDIL